MWPSKAHFVSVTLLSLHPQMSEGAATYYKQEGRCTVLPPTT